MNEKLVKAIIDFCDEYDYSFRDSYSGRGMYGRNCVGVVGSSVLETIGDLLEYLNENYEFDMSDLIEMLLKGANTDSMGLGTIIYWQQLQMTDELYEEFEDEWEDAE